MSLLTPSRRTRGDRVSYDRVPAFGVIAAKEGDGARPVVLVRDDRTASRADGDHDLFVVGVIMFRDRDLRQSPGLVTGKVGTAQQMQRPLPISPLRFVESRDQRALLRGGDTDGHGFEVSAQQDRSLIRIDASLGRAPPELELIFPAPLIPSLDEDPTPVR